MAARLAKGLGNRLAWQSQANEVFPILPKSTIEQLRAAGAVFYEWPADGVGPDDDCIRLVTSFVTTEAEVDRFLSLL